MNRELMYKLKIVTFYTGIIGDYKLLKQVHLNVNGCLFLHVNYGVTVSLVHEGSY